MRVWHRLGGGRILARTLISVYYDTDDLRLASGGITLRRRIDAESASWQLKLPRLDARLELEWDSPDERVPDELARLLIGHTRRRPLSRVAVLRTRRGVFWRGEIARHAVVAIAVKAGLPRLAADRAGRAVAGVVTACRERDVTVTAALDGSTAVATIAGGGDVWCRESVVALEALGAQEQGGGVTFSLRRTPLRGV